MLDNLDGLCKQAITSQRASGGLSALYKRPAHRNWPAEVFGSLSHTTATTSPGSITAHPVSRSRRTKLSGRTPTPVSFSFSVVTNPT
jgi:hypothetical protein